MQPLLQSTGSITTPRDSAVAAGESAFQEVDVVPASRDGVIGGIGRLAGGTEYHVGSFARAQLTEGGFVAQQRRVHPAVVVPLKLQDQISPGEGPRQAKRKLQRFAPAGSQGDAFRTRNQALDELAYLRLKLMLRAVRVGVAGRLRQRLYHPRMAMAEDQRTPRERVVDVLVAVDVP